MIVKIVKQENFKAYGKIYDDYSVKELIAYMESKEIPDSVEYVPSDKQMENFEEVKMIQDFAYGEMPVQVGYCTGHNQKLNAVEYHKSSEINIAVTDMILLLGLKQDITDDYRYDTSKMEAFFIPKGSVIEMYSTTLHYAPCSANSKGFSAIVILPLGTNTDLSVRKRESGEGKLLVAKNKWLIAHEEAKLTNAFQGLIGENLSIELGENGYYRFFS